MTFKIKYQMYNSNYSHKISYLSKIQFPVDHPDFKIQEVI